MSPRKAANPPSPSQHGMSLRPRNRTTRPPQPTAPVTPSVTPPQPQAVPAQPQTVPANPPLLSPTNASAAPVLQLRGPLPGPQGTAARRLEIQEQPGTSGVRKDIKGKGRRREPSQESGYRTDFSSQRAPSHDVDAMDTGEDPVSLSLQTPTRQHVSRQVPDAPLRSSHRRPARASSLPPIGVPGSSRYAGMRPIYEEDEDMGDVVSSYQVPEPHQREETPSFTHISDLRRASIDSELEVADMLYPRSAAEIDSVPRRHQVAPQIAQLEQQVQPTPPNYPQNAALRRGPTLQNL